MLDLTNLECLAGIAATLAAAVLALNKAGLVHFGRAPQASTGSCDCPAPDCQRHFQALLNEKVDKDPETSGSHHISSEAKSKLNLYRPAEMQDAVCREQVATITLNFQNFVDKRLEKVDSNMNEMEKRIIRAVKNGGNK